MSCEQLSSVCTVYRGGVKWRKGTQSLRCLAIDGQGLGEAASRKGYREGKGRDTRKREENGRSLRGQGQGK